MDSMVVSVESNMVTLAWVIGAFEYVRKYNQLKLVPYLIDLSEDLVFEMEMAQYRASMLPQLAKQTA